MPRARKVLPLQGWYVISLRPLGQHAALRRQATRLGARTFAVSTLRLNGLDAGEALADALRCPRVIVTSPSAVHYAASLRSLKQRAGQDWFAPGAGTAAELRLAGIERVRFPARGAGSEALLEDALLQRLEGARVGLVTAPGGRDLLPGQLRERGAKLCVANVYEREVLRPPAARLRALAALPARSALLVSSSEALSGLWDALDDQDRERLLERTCVVSSPRLARQARALGWQAPVRAEDTRPERMLAALSARVAGIR
jgi:uroporphyrinogen-III synthase